jgi:hypothetical protein
LWVGWIQEASAFDMSVHSNFNPKSILQGSFRVGGIQDAPALTCAVLSRSHNLLIQLVDFGFQTAAFH